MSNLGLVFVTFVITQLPWLISWVMPDVFAGLGFLALLLLLLRSSDLGIWQTSLLAVLTGWSALMSTANMLAYLAAGIGFVFVRLTSADRISRSALTKGAAGLVGVVMLAVLPNLLLYGRTTTNAASQALVFAKLAEEGLAQAYLEKNCQRSKFRICDFLPVLEELKGHRQGFLWDDYDKLAFKTGAWLDETGEFSRLVFSIILDNPAAVLRMAFRSTFELLSLSSLGIPEADGNFRVYSKDDHVYRNIHNWFPGAASSFDTSRQQSGSLHLPQIGQYYAALQSTGYFLAIAVFAAALFRRNRLVLELVVLTTAFVVASAVVHASLVGPYVRYQVKAAWVLWPIIFVSIPCLVNTVRGRLANVA